MSKSGGHYTLASPTSNSGGTCPPVPKVYASEPISHRFRDKRRFPSKIANFPLPCKKGFPLEFGIGASGHKSLNDGATRWSKKF